jgi:hypothetical protein
VYRLQVLYCIGLLLLPCQLKRERRSRMIREDRPEAWSQWTQRWSTRRWLASHHGVENVIAESINLSKRIDHESSVALQKTTQLPKRKRRHPVFCDSRADLHIDVLFSDGFPFLYSFSPTHRLGALLVLEQELWDPSFSVAIPRPATRPSAFTDLKLRGHISLCPARTV